MTKKMKILVSTVVAIFVLGIVGTVTIMAQSPTPTPTPTITPPARPNINARVAVILGITEAQLTDAMKQARTALATPIIPATPATPTKPIRPAPIKPADLYAKVAQILNNPKITAGTIVAAFQQAEKEMRDQAINSSLDNAVKNSKITQDEENQIKAWYQSRPAALDKLGIPFGPGPIQPNIRGKINTFENHLKGLQNQFNNFKSKLNGIAPKTSPPVTGS